MLGVVDRTICALDIATEEYRVLGAFGNEISVHCILADVIRNLGGAANAIRNRNAAVDASQCIIARECNKLCLTIVIASVVDHRDTNKWECWKYDFQLILLESRPTSNI